MSNTQREYSGWLQVTLEYDQRKRLDSLARGAGICLDIADGYIEFEYQGRDSNRFVLRFLAQVAAIIGDAEGEVRCDIESQNGDPAFEFYSFRGGKLFRQNGWIRRGPKEEVERPSSHE